MQGYGTGVAAETALGGAGALTKSFFDILGGKKTGSVAEQALSKEGEAMMPKSVPVGKEIVNKSDPNVSYIKSNDLGVTPAGDKMLSKVETDSKTGKTTVTLDKSLDNNPAQKALVIDNAHGKIVAARTQPTLFENKTMLDKSMEDFAKVQGRSEADISASLNKEIKKFGSFQEAQDAYKADPAATKVKAPTFSALMEHQTSPTTQIHTTSAVDIAKEAVDKMKAETGTSKIANTVEAKAIEQGYDKNGFKEKAQFTKINKAEEYGKASEVISDRQKMINILQGKEELPEGIEPEAFLMEARRVATENKDFGLSEEIAKSKFTSDTSKLSQKFGLLNNGEKENAPARVAEGKQSKSGGEKGVKRLKEESDVATKKISKTRAKLLDYNKILDALTCK